MGYYVNLQESTVQLAKENLDEAFRCFHALETNYDHLKHGGSRTEKWFSWMNDWTEDCKNAIDVFERLGFDIIVHDGFIEFDSYDNKTGQEDLFFRAIAHLIPDESVMFWVGEDNHRWVWLFDGGKMFIVKRDKTEEFMPDFHNPLPME